MTALRYSLRLLLIAQALYGLVSDSDVAASESRLLLGSSFSQGNSTYEETLSPTNDGTLLIEDETSYSPTGLVTVAGTLSPTLLGTELGTIALTMIPSEGTTIVTTIVTTANDEQEVPEIEPDLGLDDTPMECGENTCGTGEYCCNLSCSICAPMGSACIAAQCTTCGSRTCMAMFAATRPAVFAQLLGILVRWKTVKTLPMCMLLQKRMENKDSGF